MQFENSLAFAQQLDADDPLAGFREQYYIPEVNGKPSVYFCGNSLGLQPKNTEKFVQLELDDWKKYGVEGHFHSTNPWKSYHHFFSEPVAELVGAKPIEVVVMNSLTVNLNLAMISFYQPDDKRYKILMEAGAFPSDQYAVEQLVKLRGYDPEDAIMEIGPIEGAHTIEDSDIIERINSDDSIAMVMIGGVNYYTGQVFDMEAITKAGHDNGVYVGYDLAHAVGNVALALHDWGVDFAVWCTYKYLNSGPGGTSGFFVHERHAHKPELPRLAGWWGHKEEERFQMKKGFIPMPGAAGWQMSNAQILPMAAHWAALELFEKAGMESLRAKSIKLTQYMDYLLAENADKLSSIIMITPTELNRRGCQFSFLTGDNGKSIFEHLSKGGVICDWREPNVIRIAPVPMYNTFEDIYRFVELLTEAAVAKETAKA